MIRDERGFWVLDVPELGDAALDEFDHLPLDPYTPGKNRRRRYSTFRMRHADGAWRGEQMPQRPFLQPKTYNEMTGGMPRVFEPVRFDPTPQMASVFEQVGLSRARDYALNLHQIRVEVDSQRPGVVVPEGPHRDGHALVLTAVFRRRNIDGGRSQLIPLGGGEPFYSITLLEGQGLLIEDERMWHHATDILLADGDLGYRDVWIVSINPWEARRYGEDFERRAISTVETR